MVQLDTTKLIGSEELEFQRWVFMMCITSRGKRDSIRQQVSGLREKTGKRDGNKRREGEEEEEGRRRGRRGGGVQCKYNYTLNHEMAIVVRNLPFLAW